VTDLFFQAMDTAVQYVVGCHDFRNLCKMDVANGVVKYERRILSASVKVLATDPFHNGADGLSGLFHLKMVISVSYGETTSVQRL
jgi:tRNA U38,U39,U40 pseudouridine synthase TruA